MAKYLIQATYTSEGIKAVIKEGGTARKEAVTKLFTAIGGKVEAFYFAFGTPDLYIILDLPDNISAAAASLPVNVSGAAKANVTVLVTPEEMDQAVQLAQRMMPTYRAPGR